MASVVPLCDGSFFFSVNAGVRGGNKEQMMKEEVVQLFTASLHLPRWQSPLQ